MLARTVCLCALVSAIYAIRCYTGNGYDNMNQQQTNTNPQLNNPIDCGAGSFTCLKMYDWNSRTYQKSCGNYNNCTTNGYQSNGPFGCYNVSGTYQVNCCCNSDSCNSAPTSSLFFAGAAIILSAAFF